MQKVFLATLGVALLSLGGGGLAAFAQDANTLALPVGDAPAAGAGGIHLTRPINKATVRETVPVKLAPADFPDKDGYVSISIDGQFRTARALPASHDDPVYLWDTKANFGTEADPKYLPDGTHAISVSLYNGQSKLLGTDTVAVQVANKISMPAGEGVMLKYQWSRSQRLRYQRHSILTAINPQMVGLPEANETIQEAQVRYIRAVEHEGSGAWLIRDQVLPTEKDSGKTTPFVSYLTAHRQSIPLQALYTLKSDYRTVNAFGDVESHMAPLSPGDHFSFSLPVLPDRRISSGDSWQSSVDVSLDWATANPTTLKGVESRLEDFEWQNNYPTAKIIETYSGPATFTPQPNSGLPSFKAQTVKYERVIYFAYNAGRVIKMDATMNISADMNQAQITALGMGGAGSSGYGGGSTYSGSPYSSGPPSGYPGMSSPGGYPGSSPGGYEGSSPGGYPGSSPGGYPGSSPGGYPGSSPASYPGMSPSGYSGSSPGGYPGSYGGSGMRPGGSGAPGMVGPGGVAIEPTTPMTLKVTDATVLLT